MKIPVESNPGLYRDSHSGAILNCSDIEYEKYLSSKKQKLKEIDQIEKLKLQVNEIDQLKSDVNEMKGMMKLILSKL